MTDFSALGPDEQLQRFEAAAQEALHHWDMQGATLQLIQQPRENAVFGVGHAGERYALKLHRLGYHTDDELHSEYRWIQALADYGLTVPTIVPAGSGDLFIKQRVAGMSDDIQVDLVEWIDGEQLGSVEEGIDDASDIAETFSTIGELAARVHNQAAAWDPPAGFARHSWDADGLAGEQPIWGQFWKVEAASQSERDLLRRGRDKVFADLSKLPQSADVYSMIHADFSPENVMVDDDGPRLIDFDDAGFGWHLFELVTSLYFIAGEPYFDQAQGALFDGYRRLRPLEEEQLELLPLFFLARGFTYVGWVHTRPETETAKELTQMVVTAACELAEDYLSNTRG